MTEQDKLEKEIEDLKELALNILELYEESEHSVIEETYPDIKSGLDILRIDVEEFKNEINGLK